MKESDSTSLKIGELVKTLQSEFPDIRVSKVRYFEDRGLLKSKRDGSGYRRYSEEEIERLRWILTTQRDEQLPLKVIERRLEEGDWNSRKSQKRKLFFEGGHTKREMRISEIAKAAGLSQPKLAELMECGIVGNGPVYNEDDLQILKAARGLMEFGIDPRNLKFFKRTAEQESTLIFQLVAPYLMSSGSNTKKAYKEIDKLVNAGSNLRAALLKREFRSESSETS